ncbi:MAG: hypothetical protein A2169_14085 [Deltaproteobacteria bacterium RBG_13_47_9]|nr:MAG: hypothetical protein A2169_14085 [Deltaproteobacteria bacterium RBG_13_47_9]
MSRKILFTILSLLAIIGLLFYWYEYRPSKIRKECVKIAETRALDTMKRRAELQPYLYKEEAERGWYLRADYEECYKQCLREHGIEK